MMIDSLGVRGGEARDRGRVGIAQLVGPESPVALIRSPSTARHAPLLFGDGHPGGERAQRRTARAQKRVVRARPLGPAAADLVGEHAIERIEGESFYGRNLLVSNAVA